MRTIGLFFSFTAFSIVNLVLCQPSGVSSEITGVKPKIFGEGIISTGDYESHPAFSPGGDTLFFIKTAPDFSSWTICLSYNKNGKWTPPKTAWFSGTYSDADPFFSKDGNTVYFISDRPIKKSDSLKTDSDIWKIVKTKNGWSDPIHLDAPINSSSDEYYPTLTENGILYFGSSRAGGKGLTDIYRSVPVSGKFTSVENLGDSINTADDEYEPFILHDESMLIFMATRPRGLQNADLFISFKTNGGWSKAKKLPYPYSSSGIEFSPKITWDKKYFFFSSTRNEFVKSPKKPESTKEFHKRIQSVGNGLGDIYRIPLDEAQKFFDTFR